MCSISLRSAYFCMSWVEASDNFKKKQSPATMFNKVSGFNCVRSHWDQPIFAWVELKPQISLKITKPSYNVQIGSWFKLCSILLRSAHFCMSWVEASDKLQNYKAQLKCSKKFLVSIVFDLTEISPILHELNCTIYIIRLL